MVKKETSILITFNIHLGYLVAMSASPECITRAEVEGMTPELLVDHLIDAGFSAYEV